METLPAGVIRDIDRGRCGAGRARTRGVTGKTMPGRPDRGVIGVQDLWSSADQDVISGEAAHG